MIRPLTYNAIVFLYRQMGERMWRFSVAGQLVLLGGVFTFAACDARAQVAFRSSALPVYNNRVYTFRVKIPPGVTYSRTEPPAPDHGFSVKRTGTKKLWVDASYSDTASTADALRTETEGCLMDEQQPARLGAALATFVHFHCPANGYHEAYEERLVLTVRSGPGRAPICYQIGLRTASQASDSLDVDLFKKLIVGFQMNGR